MVALRHIIINTLPTTKLWTRAAIRCFAHSPHVFRVLFVQGSLSLLSLQLASLIFGMNPLNQLNHDIEIIRANPNNDWLLLFPEGSPMVVNLQVLPP